MSDSAGARRGIRTPDRLIKSQLLYQLSYAGRMPIVNSKRA